MPWLFPSIVSSLCGTIVLFLIYTYLYVTYSDRFLGIWATSWGFYGLRFVATLMMIAWGSSPFLLFVSEGSTIVSAYLLFCGTALFIRAKIHPPWLWVAGFVLSWTAIGIYYNFSFLLLTTPSYLLTAAVYLWMGWKVLKSDLPSGIGKTVTAAAMVLWGLHKANYPFLRHVEWFAPWGFLLGGILSLTAALGILLVYFEKTRRELTISEARNRKLFEEAYYGIVLAEPETGKILDCNNAFAAMLGVSREAIIGTQQQAWYHPDEKPEGASEAQMSTAAGGLIDVEIKAQFVNYGDQVVNQIFFQDITGRKQTEQALRESESKFRKLLKSTPLPICYVNADGTVAFRNERFVKIFGYDEIAVPTLTEWWLKAYPDPEYRKWVIDKWDSAVREAHGTGQDIEPEVYHVTCHDGTVREVIISGIVILENFLATFIDITELRRAEEENIALQERLQRSEKMEALGTLAGGVAHDLNNVLGIIVGYAEMAHDSVDKSDPLYHRIETIMNGGLKAAAIVEDLLTLARRGVQGRSIINLNRIVADCQTSPEFKNLLSYHPTVKIKTDLDQDLLNISGSSVHLGKTLYNLISNASEAMPKGGTVTIKTTQQYLDMPVQGYDHIREGEYVVLSVSDTGEGISDIDLKRIFEPFYTKKIMGRSGTGLGLAVVWSTVKDHSGYINVQSEEGKGSTFTLYFPVTREEVTVEAIAVPTSEYMGKGETVLVVDDVKEQRDLAASILGALNYRVTTASSGEEAVKYLKDYQVDLMVLDMIMDPGMDGLDTYRHVINIRKNQKAIIVSGFSESDRVKTARSLGAGAYVKKPYVREKLGLAVRKELDK